MIRSIQCNFYVDFGSKCNLVSCMHPWSAHHHSLAESVLWGVTRREVLEEQQRCVKTASSVEMVFRLFENLFQSSVLAWLHSLP